MINLTNLSRREFIAALMAGGVITAQGLWMPGTKLISIPKRIMVPPGLYGVSIATLSEPMNQRINADLRRSLDRYCQIKTWYDGHAGDCP